MGLRAKIVLPLLMLGLLFAAYMWFIWAPGYLQEEREHYLGYYQMELDIFADGISPELERGDLEAVYHSLDLLKTDYPLFKEIRFEGNAGETLYVYKNPDVAANADLEEVIQGVDMVDGKGLLRLRVDLNPAIELDKAGLNKPLRLLWILLLAIMAPIAFLLDRWLRVPLVKLSRAATSLMHGNYMASLPPPSNDEVGALTRQFDEMRKVIGRNEREIHQEIIERKHAEVLLARDYEVQKVIEMVLRVSMDAVSLEEMLEKALDAILDLSWLTVEQRGAIFMVEGGGDGLVVKSKRNMPDMLLVTCRKIAMDHCLCEKPSSLHRVVFSSHADDCRKTRYEGMESRRLIIIPLLFGERLLGVMNFYVADDGARDQLDERVFFMLADTIAIAVDRKRTDLLLREQAQIMAQIRDAVIGVDLQLSIRVWNQGASRLFGLSGDEVIGKDISALFSQEDGHDAYKKIFSSVMTAGYGEADVTMVKKSGEVFFAHFSVSLFKDNNNKTTGILAYVMDNTEPRRMREELLALNDTLEQQVKERTHEVMNQKFALDQHAIVGVTDKAGRIIYVNDKFCEISGYDREELLGLDHRVLNSGYHVHDYFKKMWHTIGHGGVWHGEIKNRRKDGNYYWVDTTIVPFMDAEGRPYQYVSIRTDITDRKEALEEQSARSARLKRQQNALTALAHEGLFDSRNLFGSFRTIMETAAHATEAERVGTWLFSPDAAELHCEALISPGAVVHVINEVIKRDDYQDFFNAIEHELIISADDVHAHPHACKLAEEHLDFRGVNSLLCIPIRVNGKVKGAVCFEHVGSLRRWHADEQQFGIVVADMMALVMEKVRRREAEARLAEAAQQLKMANRQLDNALVEAQAAVHAKSEFLATMSHEVRTPMNGIMGMLDLLRDSDLDEQDRKYANIAYSSAEMLLDLLNDVLDFSKIEAGRLQLELIDFNPSHVVEDVVNLMRSLAAAKQLSFTAVMSEKMPAQICGDPLRFRQVLANLISNAIKFTGDGSVTIRGDLVRGKNGLAAIRFEVQDTGIGLAVEDRERIFEAFAQADGSITRRYGGSGLGLTICKQLVCVMGGEIGVSSIAGKGSLFWFTVPVAGQESTEANGVESWRGAEAAG